MKLPAVTALVLALASPAWAEDPQPDTMAYIRSVQAQRDRALNDQALAEARIETMRAALAKAQGEAAELRKKLEEKAPAPQQ